MRMFSFRSFFCVFIFTNIFCGIQTTEIEAFNNLDAESNACATGCTKTNPSLPKACVRGCRLFSICEWATSNLTEAFHECKLSCTEAYATETDGSEGACNGGCEAALPLATQRREKENFESQHMQLMNSSPFASVIGNNVFGGFFPQMSDDSFIDIDDMMNRFMNSASQSFSMMQSLMFSSKSTHTQIIDIDDGTSHEIIVIEYLQPEINTPHPIDKKILLNTDSGGSKTTLEDLIESNLQTNANSKPQLVIQPYNDYDWVGSDDYDYSLSGQFRDWWDCFTKKAGLPELVLLLFWFSTLLVLVMACLAQFKTKPHKLSINGDLAYITDSKGNLPPYMKTYPCPASAKKSPYYMASVVQTCEDKVPLMDRD